MNEYTYNDEGRINGLVLLISLIHLNRSKFIVFNDNNSLSLLHTIICGSIYIQFQEEVHINIQEGPLMGKST